MGHFSSQMFRGNNDQNSIKIQALSPPVYGRFIRIHPWSWYKHISMRVEFYGCKTGQLEDFTLRIYLKWSSLDIQCRINYQQCAF